MLNLDNLSIILFILPAYQMSFFVVQLISFNSKKDPSRKPLGFLMLFMLLYILINTSKYLGYLDAYKYLYFFQLPVLLTIIPTYCRYLWAISNTSWRASKSSLLCFLPALLVLLLNFISFINHGANPNNLFLYSEHASLIADRNGASLIHITFLLGNVVLIAIQVTIATIQFRKQIKQIIVKRKENSFFLPYFETGWATIIFISVISFVIINSLMNYFTPEYTSSLATTFNILILISGSLAGYLGLKQDNLYTKIMNSIDTDQSDNRLDKSNKTLEKKDTFTLSKTETDEIITALHELFISKKPYLNSELRLIDVSRELNTSKHKLTYVLNHEMKSSFYYFVNKFRIEEAQNMLKQREYHKYNLETIAEMAGFQSKSSFNSCFKKITKITPSAYRKNHDTFNNVNK